MDEKKDQEGLKNCLTQFHVLLRKRKQLFYKKRNVQPVMKNVPKEKRLKWNREHMSWKQEWHKVIFSDEKKFNLDGPDGWAYYWHDLRQDDQQGDGSLMVWGAFSWNGKTNLAFPSGRMNANAYQELLEESLLPFAEKIGGVYFEFQQDNAPIHVAKTTWQWFMDNGVQVMDWPPLSPDLNPMENAWGLLSRAVYANGQQYNNIVELKAVFTNCLPSQVTPMLHAMFQMILLLTLLHCCQQCSNINTK
uniref:Tc1-like transposase DDE domain-containing protein n=1 Tax=Strigamia maritima TaxID=126957 RepID=T1IMR3_STRMM